MKARYKNIVLEKVEISTEIAEQFDTVTLCTDFDKIEARFYNKTKDSKSALIWFFNGKVGGVAGDFDSPAKNMYPELCNELQNENNIASLRIRFRYPKKIGQCVYDVLAGVEFLTTHKGFEQIGLIGHSLGGAVVVQAAAISPHNAYIRCVVALSPQRHGATICKKLPANCTLCLIHGEKDDILPSYYSKDYYQQAHEPKSILILPDDKHCLEESAELVKKSVKDVIIHSFSNFSM